MAVDLKTADKALLEIRKANEDFDAEKEIIDAQIEILKNKLKGYKDKKDEIVNKYTEDLKIFLDKELLQNPDYQLKTETGQGYYRTSKKFNYLDEKATLEFLEENNFTDLVRVRKSLDKNKIKKAFALTADGEYITDSGDIVPEIKVTEEKSFILKFE